jgi:hypothetical protein
MWNAWTVFDMQPTSTDLSMRQSAHGIASSSITFPVTSPFLIVYTLPSRHAHTTR